MSAPPTATPGIRSDLSVGLAHDYLLVFRGAERTFAAIAETLPVAPVYTLFYDEAGTEGRFRGHPIRTSALQRLGVNQHSFRRLLPLLPAATARLPAQRHDLVISSSSAFAHGIRTAEAGTHLCYCHTPFRYAWFEQARALGEVGAVQRPALRASLAMIRRRDRRIARRVTRYVANSEFCRERIARFWGREAEVVHPPVEIDRFSTGAPEDYFLIVCELVRHKRVDFALEAADRAGRKVVVVGDGPERCALEARFGARHRFAGRIADDELNLLLSSALALLVPNVEEFGIAAVEAQAAGRPVLGVDAGGLRETVISGVTGELTPEGNSDAYVEALREIDFARYEPARIRENAERFSVEAFQRKLWQQVALALDDG